MAKPKIENFPLIEIADMGNGVVKCRERENGKEWVITRKIFNKFKWSGFPILPSKSNEIVFELMANKEYTTMTEGEKLHVISTLINLSK